MGKEKGPLEDLVKKLIEDMGRTERPTEEEIAGLWEDAVGKAASRHSRPVSFKMSNLVVVVAGSSRLYELTVKKKEIFEKLEGRLGSRKIKEIRFRIGEIKKNQK